MFTIFGASGNTGSVVAQELLAQGKRVRVFGRDANKLAALAKAGAEVATGDVLDPQAVARALDGAEGAYVLMPPDMANENLLARNERLMDVLVDALAKAKTPHVVLLSSVGAHEPAGTGPIVSTHVAEKKLRALSGTKVTAIRAAYFMENILGFAGAMKGDGVLPVFGGGETFRFPMIATKDIGKLAAKVLLAPPAQSEVIELSGPQEYSFTDAATAATKILGRPVKAHALPIDALVPTFTSFGVSAHVAGLYREMTEGLGKGLVRFDGSGRAVRGTTTLDEVLAQLR